MSKFKADDIQVGMLVCRPPSSAGPADGWFAKWFHKIGYRTAAVDGVNFVLIAMSDGLVGRTKTAEEVAQWLNENAMVPMREEWLIKVNHWQRLTLGLQGVPIVRAPGDSSDYSSRCFTFGRSAGRHPGFLLWWYAPNEALGGKSPRDAVDAGRLSTVEDLWDAAHPVSVT